MRRILKAILANSLTVVALGLWNGGAQAGPGDFYAGKQITFVVGTAAGGGYDEYVRVLIVYLTNHIPGQPSIIVQNRPGASGLTAAAYMYAVAPKDGTMLAMCPSIMLLNEALNPNGVRFKSANFNWIGNITPTTHILAVGSDAGVANIDDARKKTVTVGATVPTGADYVESVLTNALIGTKFNIVKGYNTGTQEMGLAMQRGEISGFIGSWDSWQGARGGLAAQNKLVYLLQIGPKVPELPNTPTLAELVTKPEDAAVAALSELIETMGRSIFTTPDVPAPQLVILRTAFEETMKDPQFIEDMKSHQLAVSPRSGEKIQKQVNDALSGNSTAAVRMRQILSDAAQ